MSEAREKAVCSAMNSLTESVDQLDKMVDELHESMGAVLSAAKPEPETDKTTVDIPATCDLAKLILALLRQIDCIRGKVQSMKLRLEA